MDLMTTEAIAQGFQAIPFTPTPDRAEVVSKIMRSVMQFETIFSDYNRACEDTCGRCEACQRCLVAITYMLSKPDSRAWEVWTASTDPELVGLLLLTRVAPGVDAEAHYAFFDGKLHGKDELIEEMIQWVFADHPGWVGLRRLTVAIPDYAYALARHAVKKLGFGGDFVRRVNGKSIPVEGVRRGAMRWRGTDRDILLMGRLR